ncbi:hypothetical protein ACSBR2_030910 [Camellia fascicularis]
MEFTSSDMNSHFKNEMQLLHPDSPMACRICSKVCFGQQRLLRHFTESHMKGNMIIFPGRQRDVNCNNPHRNDRNRYPNHLRPSSSSQPPSLSHEIRQKSSHKRMNRNPNSKKPQVVSAAPRVPSRNNHSFFPNLSSSSYADAVVVAQPMAQPAPLPIIHYHTMSIGGGGGGGSGGCYYMLRPSLALEPPPHPLVMTNYALALEADRACWSSDFTRPLINKLDHPIEKMVEGNNYGDDGFNSNGLDLTLRL